MREAERHRARDPGIQKAMTGAVFVNDPAQGVSRTKEEGAQKASGTTGSLDLPQSEAQCGVWRERGRGKSRSPRTLALALKAAGNTKRRGMGRLSVLKTLVTGMQRIVWSSGQAQRRASGRLFEGHVGGAPAMREEVARREKRLAMVMEVKQRMEVSLGSIKEQD